MTVRDRDRMESECRRARDEIVDTLCAEDLPRDGFAVVHLGACESCREWYADISWMRSACREIAGAGDPSPLTAIVLERYEMTVMGRGEEPGAGPERPLAPGRPSAEARGADGSAADRPLLAVMALFVAAFNAALAFRLAGTARLVAPLMGAAVMIAPALWIFADARRRGMRAGFWALLYPLTLPIGLALYLLMRRGAVIACPGCGAPLPGSVRHCPLCGRKLRSVCCGCGSLVREDFQVCPRCGVILETCVEEKAVPDSSGRWRACEIAFLIGVNAALLAAFLRLALGAPQELAVAAGAAYFLGWLPVVNWVLVDAKRRGAAYYAWGVVAVLTGYVGLVAYLALRPAPPDVCPVCEERIRDGVNFCPRCGSLLRPACPKCGAEAREGDAYCSSCGERLALSADAFRPSPE